MDTRSKYKILIVDDVPKNIELAANILKTRNYNITFAKNGPIALEKVKAIPFDLILLDIMMPVMDGFEVCRRLKTDPSTKNIPVIFLTAKSETEHIVRGFELGAVDYVTKPFNADELLARVTTHVGIKEMLDEKDRIEAELLKNKDIQERLLQRLETKKKSDEQVSEVLQQMADNEKAGKELEKKKNEISDVTLFYDLRSQFDKFLQNKNPVDRLEIRQVKEMISNLFIDKNNHEFHRELKRRYPRLTFDDLRLCSYLRLHFLNTEIAEFLESSPEAVYTRKSRLKQKLGLQKDQDISEFLARIM